ncbi:MAG: hypothetical protein A2498_01095 [Lentisphaerae bacterium RIFOXYC12_FULL_60_16]|nr:MAG: hypothetical protein A2498_01095 [Lentisphaerae bacterium RIFOXYC12_FULL_60_16]OGV83796.1 MAG: hypothetical protein A2340_06775 [Lentisphaerae bacterium RIFOXYB12_FULL_60_10]
MKAECDRQAVVWDAIERLAFRPSTADRQRWLWCYVRSLRTLWGVEPTDVVTRGNTGFDAWFLGIACNYAIEVPDRYSVTIMNAAATAPACWCVHVDPDYLSRSALFESCGDYPSQDMDAHLERDVATVLDGMLFHPRNHAHGDAFGIVSQLDRDTSLTPSEIRLGGGIDNGFVFLTHLRYQLCLLSADGRQTERTRLVRLFTAAIRNGCGAISAAVLFDLRV